MAYTVLARRYRSNTFDEVVGQNHIAQTLKKAITSGRIAHAFLFCGTRGTGKTSTARILAKCLNCQSADHPVTVPCNQCGSCQAISRGDDIDVIEIDAASNTGVDNIRDVIISSAYNSPARSRFRIFIIDEVHMLSKSAFNALLKTLEEPPAHVKFILATTEPEKVLPTILSRCQRYDFRNIPTREIAGHLKAICSNEKIEASDDALLLVAKAGAGSMRDSLSLLDRLLSIGETKLTVELLEQMLGLPRSQLIANLAASIGSGDVKSTLQQADALISNGLSIDTLIVTLVDHLRTLMLLRVCGPDTQLVEVPGQVLRDLQQQAALFDPAALSQDIVILEELRRHVRQSQAGQALLDACLVRMALSDQFSNLAELAGQAADGTVSTPAQKKKPIESVTPVVRESARSQVDTIPEPTLPTTATQPATSLPATPAMVTGDAPAELISQSSPDDDDDDLPAVGKVWEAPTESLATLLARHSAGATVAAVTGDAPGAGGTTAVANAGAAAATDQASTAGLAVGGHLLSERWEQIVSNLSATAPALGGVFAHFRPHELRDGKAVIRYLPQHETFVKMLDRNGKKEMIREAITRGLGQPMGVHFELDTSAATENGHGQPGAVPAGASVPANRGVAAGGTSASASPMAVQAAASPGSARSTMAAKSARPTPPPPPVPPVMEANTIRVTEEIRRKLYESDALVKAVVDQLGGNIIKIEAVD